MVSSYTYGKDNLPTKFNINEKRSVTYAYDSLDLNGISHDGFNQLKTAYINTDKPIIMNYTYHRSDRGNAFATAKLETEAIDGVTYRYEYDSFGNITDIFRKNGDTEKHIYYYEYDSLNQLTYAADYERNKIYTYLYDAGGNINAETISDTSANGIPYNTKCIDYSYDDPNWTDKLTSYDGQTITYDEIGNPLTYRDGIAMTWKNGRQLASLQKGENSVNYNYDSSNVRISKNVNGTDYTYAYVGGKLIYKTKDLLFHTAINLTL